MSSNQLKAYDRVFIAGTAARERILRKLIGFDESAPRRGRPPAGRRATSPAPALPRDGRTVVLYAPTTGRATVPSMRYSSVGQPTAVPLVALARRDADGTGSSTARTRALGIVAARVPPRRTPRSSACCATANRADPARRSRRRRRGRRSAGSSTPPTCAVTDISAVAYDWLATGEAAARHPAGRVRAASCPSRACVREMELFDAADAGRAPEIVDAAVRAPRRGARGPGAPLLRRHHARRQHGALPRRLLDWWSRSARRPWPPAVRSPGPDVQDAGGDSLPVNDVPARLGPPGEQLALIALVQVLAMSSWFSASAVVPALRDDWGITTGEGTLLTVAVQLGFVTGAVASAVLSLADGGRRPGSSRARRSSRPRRPPRSPCSSTPSGRSAPPLPHRGGAGRRLPDRPQADGVVVRAGPRPRDRRPRRRAHARQRPAAAAQRPGGPVRDRHLPWRPVLLTSSLLCLAAAVVAAGPVRLGPLAAPAPPFDPRYVLRLRATAGRASPTSATSGTCGSSTRCGPGCRPTSPPASPSPQGTARATAVGVIAFAVIGVGGAVGAGRRLARRPRRSGPGGRWRHGGQRRLLRARGGGVRRAAVRAAARARRLGRHDHRRLGALLHPDDRGRRPSLRRHGPDDADRGRLPADRGHHQRGAVRRRRRRVAWGGGAARARSGRRCGGDGPWPPAARHVPDGRGHAGAAQLRASRVHRGPAAAPGDGWREPRACGRCRECQPHGIRLVVQDSGARAPGGRVAEVVWWHGCSPSTASPTSPTASSTRSAAR